jgi:tetratricopeptide (TPR) repeat protein
VLTSLAEIEEWLGHIDASEAAAEEAALVAESSGDAQVLADALRSLAWVAHWRGEHKGAVVMEERALEVATALDERRRLAALHDLGVFQAVLGLKDEARSTLRSAAEGAHDVGDLELETGAAANLADLDLYARDFASAYQSFRTALEGRRTIDPHPAVFVGLGWAALGLERRQEAREAFGEALELSIDAGMTSRYEFIRAVTGVALAAEAADARQAARLRGAAARLGEIAESTPHDEDRELDRFFEQSLIAALGQHEYANEQALGSEMTLDEVIEVARSLGGRIGQ